MRNPRRYRNLSLVIFLSGAAAGAAAIIMPDAGRGFTLQSVLGLYGLPVVVLAGVATLVIHCNVRTQDRLLRGEDVIARWNIDPVHWQAFVTLNEQLDQERGPHLLNALSIRRQPAAHDVEVVVAKTAVQVDGDFHALPTGTYPVTGLERLPGPPACLEFALLYPAGPGDSDSRMSLRFPIAPGPLDEELAARVISYYRSARDAIVQKRLIEIRNPRRVIAVLLGIAALCAAAFIIGMLLRKRDDLGLFPPLAALCGAMIGLGALMFALVVYVRRNDL